ncbi:unnamed protein product [Gordionus sp. m RMFG-2023]
MLLDSLELNQNKMNSALPAQIHNGDSIYASESSYRVKEDLSRMLDQIIIVEPDQNTYQNNGASKNETIKYLVITSPEDQNSYQRVNDTTNTKPPRYKYYDEKTSKLQKYVFGQHAIIRHHQEGTKLQQQNFQSKENISINSPSNYNGSNYLSLNFSSEMNSLFDANIKESHATLDKYYFNDGERKTPSLFVTSDRNSNKTPYYVEDVSLPSQDIASYKLIKHLSSEIGQDNDSCTSPNSFEPQWRDRCNTWPLQRIFQGEGDQHSEQSTRDTINTPFSIKDNLENSIMTNNHLLKLPFDHRRPSSIRSDIIKEEIEENYSTYGKNEENEFINVSKCSNRLYQTPTTSYLSENDQGFSKNENYMTKKTWNANNNYLNYHLYGNSERTRSSIFGRGDTILSYDPQPLPILSHEDIMFEEDNYMSSTEEPYNYSNQTHNLYNGYEPHVYNTLRGISHPSPISDFHIKRENSYILNNPKEPFEKGHIAQHILSHTSNSDSFSKKIKDYHYNQLKVSPQFMSNFPVSPNNKNGSSTPSIKGFSSDQHNDNDYNNNNTNEENENDYKNSMNGTGGVPTSRRNAWGNFSYADLITKAILTSPDKRLTLSQIYDWMVQYIPYFKDKGDNNSSAGWKNSIRHNLSLHNRFIRVQNEGAGKSSWWMINPEARTGKTVRRRAATLDNTKSCITKRGRIRKRTNTLQNNNLKPNNLSNSCSPKNEYLMPQTTPQSLYKSSVLHQTLTTSQQNPNSPLSTSYTASQQSSLTVAGNDRSSIIYSPSNNNRDHSTETYTIPQNVSMEFAYDNYKNHDSRMSLKGHNSNGYQHVIEYKNDTSQATNREYDKFLTNNDIYHYNRPDSYMKCYMPTSSSSYQLNGNFNQADSMDYKIASNFGNEDKLAGNNLYPNIYLRKFENNMVSLIDSTSGSNKVTSSSPTPSENIEDSLLRQTLKKPIHEPYCHRKLVKEHYMDQVFKSEYCEKEEGSTPILFANYNINTNNHPIKNKLQENYHHNSNDLTITNGNFAHDNYCFPKQKRDFEHYKSLPLPILCRDQYTNSVIAESAIKFQYKEWSLCAQIPSKFNDKKYLKNRLK